MEIKTPRVAGNREREMAWWARTGMAGGSPTGCANPACDITFMGLMCDCTVTHPGWRSMLSSQLGNPGWFPFLSPLIRVIQGTRGPPRVTPYWSEVSFPAGPGRLLFLPVSAPSSASHPFHIRLCCDLSSPFQPGFKIRINNAAGLLSRWWIAWETLLWLIAVSIWYSILAFSLRTKKPNQKSFKKKKKEKKKDGWSSLVFK